MIPKTNARPKEPFPNCRYCQKPLRSYWKLEWPIKAQSPLSQTWAGYGRLGNGLFCSLTCGYLWAVAFLKGTR